MTEDVEMAQDKPCCDTWKKKYTKLVDKCSKLEEIKNQFRGCTTIIQQKYDVIEKENESLKQALGDLEVQVSNWKDEKEKESAIRVDLEDEVSALKEEIQLLKKDGNGASQEADVQLQERLSDAEKEINRLNKLLVKEKARADSAKKKAEAERKKANSTLKEVQMEKNKANEAQGVADVEKKKAEENRLLLEKLQKETDVLKSLLASERSKAEAAAKKLEVEKQKTIREKKRADSVVAKAEEQRKLAEFNLKKAEEIKQMEEKLKTENQALKSTLTSERSKSEEAEKKLEVEKQKTAKEKKRADLAVANAKVQQELAEANLKQARFEKDRADDLNRKLEEEINRAGKLEEELHERLCTVKLVGPDPSSTGRIAELETDVLTGMGKGDASTIPPRMKKMLLEKEENLVMEKKRADSGTKKAKKQRKIAEEQKQIAIEEKHRADQLSKELEVYKQRFEELQKELKELVSYKTNTVNTLGYSNNISDTDSVKLLKKELKLEKMLVKHAKKATKLEAVRNNMLHQELFHLKQECLQFQQRLDLLDNSFFSDGEGIHELEKMGDPTFTRKKFYSDGSHRQLTSGISSRLSPPCRGSKQKILQSSAINSSSASFSDQPLVGSQERGTFSVMSSAKLGEDISSLKPTIPRLADKISIKYNENAIAENSIRSPDRGNTNGRTAGCCNKKRILTVVESVENLCFKGQRLHQRVSEKLSQLQGVLCGQKDEPAEDNRREDSCRKDLRPSKRRKTSCDRAIVFHPSLESGEPKSMFDSGIDDSDAGMLATPADVGAMKFGHHLDSGTANTLGSNQCIPQDFEDIENFDYMKLLDLDNDVDEKAYRIALTVPLSPTLPEIEFHGVEAFEVDNPQRLVDNSSKDGSSIIDNLGPSSSFDIFDMHKNHADLVLNGLVSPQLGTEKDSVQLLENRDILRVSEAQFHQVQVSGERFGISDTSCPGDKGMNKLCESRTAHGNLLKYFVIFSENKDSNCGILRILENISSCMLQCSLNHSADFLRDLLVALKNAQDLSAKERACVFFSISLYQISEVGLRNLTNVLSDNSVRSLGSLTLHICSALSDQALRRLFMESCGLSELLSLIEDFLLQKKVMAYANVSSESPGLCNPKANLVLNGNPIVLSEQAASSELLVAGASLLASLCSAVDHIGFVCETSCNVFMTNFLDPDTMLAVLHSFAHACGSRYFTLQQSTLEMTVIKSLVMFLEKQTISTNSSTISLSQGDTMSKNWSCNTNCPFTEGAVSVENVALLLLEKLQKYGQSVSGPQELSELVNPPVPRLCSSEERIGVSGPKEGVDSLGDKSDENLFSFTDILSFIEILASFMGWDWTRDTIIGQLCELVESRLMEGFSTAIFILLGQLGRLGVDTSGYEDIGIKKLRGWLSSFLCEKIFSKLSLPVQFSIVTALFCISPIKIEEIVKNKVQTPIDTSQSIPAYFISKWFSLLSNEQQSFFRLHQEANETYSVNLPLTGLSVSTT